jgi:tRNA nucleotidyltransferase (CCA-adding enzyme)
MRTKALAGPDKPLAALRRRPEIVRLRRLLSRSGTRGWVVGGAVRDAALGIPVPEVDIAIAGDAEILARKLEAEGAGRAVFLSRGRPGPRVFRLAGPRPLDVAELEGGSIGTDLARRDFTVNAVALSLGEQPAVVDPFGGLEDLSRRRLRCVSERNILDDPVRALRAARFVATHGLHPDAGALEAARRAAPGLRAVAPERVAAELSKLLESARAAPALTWAARARVLRPALALDIPADRLASAARSLAHLDDAVVRGLSPERRRRLRLAFLAAKLRLAPPVLRRWLDGRRFGRQEIARIERLVLHAERARRVASLDEAWRWTLDAGDLAADAALLLARLHPAEKARARRLARLSRRRPKTVRVTGEDVVRWLAIPPGPEVGRLLAELRVAAALGRVRDRREARHWLSGQVRGGL